MRRIFTRLPVVLTFLALLLLVDEIFGRFAVAASLQLSWADNSTDEDGFNIDRSLVSGGPYATIGTVGPNVTTYNDTNLLNGTTYCYRVNAFNSAGASPYSLETCVTTVATLITFNLIVSSAGTGNGTVTSSPAGINCSTSCSASFNAGTIVTLTATAASDSTFGGWSGTGCATGYVTMSAATSCTANFTINDTSSPSVSSIAANPIDLATPLTSFTITGGGFVNAGFGLSVVNFTRSGQVLAQARASSGTGTTLNIPFPGTTNIFGGALPGLSAGLVTVQVYNQTGPNSWSLTGSTSLTVNDTRSVPSVTSITPNPIDLASPPAALTIAGGGFVNAGFSFGGELHP